MRSRNRNHVTPQTSVVRSSPSTSRTARTPRSRQELLREIERVQCERDAYRAELLFRANREYSESAAQCFQNRRALARAIGEFFHLNKTEIDALCAYATAAEHGTPDGGHYMLWVVNRFRTQSQMSQAQASQLLDLLQDLMFDFHRHGTLLPATLARHASTLKWATDQRPSLARLGQRDAER